jgi:hypothetical protein
MSAPPPNDVRVDDLLGTPTIPPGFLTRWCDAMATGSESPPEAFLATGLAVLSGVLGPRMQIHWGDTHQERCNLWLLSAGRSALGRKTSGMSSLRSAYRWASAAMGDQLRWYTALRLSDAALAADLDVVGPDTRAAQDEENKRAKQETVEARREDKSAAEVEPADIPPQIRPVPVSWIVSLNELTNVWGDHLSDYQRNAQQFMLSLFDGRLSSSTRATSVPDQETFVTCLGNIPVSELRDRTTGQMLRSGFVGRWLIIPSPAPVAPMAMPMLSTDRSHIDAIRRDVEDMAACGAYTRPIFVNNMWRKGTKAYEVREAWYSERWHKLRDDQTEDGASEGELWGRLQATAVKVASLLAVARACDLGMEPDACEVEESDVVWAHDLVDASAKYLLGVVAEGGGAAVTTMGKIENRVMNRLRRVGATSKDSAIYVSDVIDSVKGRDGRDAARMALDGLFRSEFVEMAEVAPGGDGKRSRTLVWMAQK